MGRRIELAPLWSLCSFDDDLLPESTSSEFSFNYVDISNVKTGRVEIPQQTFTIANAPSRARRLARPGDVVVSTVRTYLRAIAPVPVSTDNLVFSTGFCVVRPHAGISDGRYINYLLTSDQVVDEIVADSTGTSYPATSPTKIARLRVPAPPLPTQRAIADYLDRETAEIDGMRADLDEMERLLTERRANIVENAFSGLRDSGCSYRKLGYVAQFRNGQDTKGMESVDGPYPVYGSGGAFKRANSYLFDGPSVLFGRKGTLDKPLLVDGKFWTVDTMYYTVLSADVYPSFLHKWAMTIPFEMHATDTALPSMTSTVLSQLPTPLPPLAEQRRIADEIDRETAEIDSMLEDITKLRDLLAERRAAVISAAVTGQIDIPASLDDKDEPHA